MYQLYLCRTNCKYLYRWLPARRWKPARTSFWRFFFFLFPLFFSPFLRCTRHVVCQYSQHTHPLAEALCNQDVSCGGVTKARSGKYELRLASSTIPSPYNETSWLIQVVNCFPCVCVWNMANGFSLCNSDCSRVEVATPCLLKQTSITLLWCFYGSGTFFELSNVR